MTGGAQPQAQIPFVVEVWAYVSRREGRPLADDQWSRIKFALNINRTPTIAPLTCRQQKNELWLSGNGLNQAVDIGSGMSKTDIDITANIATSSAPSSQAGSPQN